MGNRKVLLIVVIAVVVLAVGAVVATFLGVDLFATHFRPWMILRVAKLMSGITMAVISKRI